MNIDQDNYQAWLLDYLEGKLSPGQVADLLTYLQVNPQVKNELDGMAQVPTLRVGMVAYPNPATLKKDAGSLSGSAADDLLIAKHEGLLDGKRSELLAKRLKKDPALKKAHDLYGRAYLQAPAIYMPNKGRLKKQPATVSLWPWMAVAASLLLLLGIGYILRQPAHTTNTHLAEETASPKQTNDKGQDATFQGLASSPGQLPSVVDTDLPVGMTADNRQNNPMPDGKGATEHAYPPTHHQMDQVWPELPATDSLFIQELWNGQWTSDFWAFAQTDAGINTHMEKPKTEPEYMGDQAIGIWDYAGMVIKRNVLDQDQVEDGRLRENDYMKAMALGINEVLPDKVDYREENRNGRVFYGFHIGNFGIERSARAK
ncbi:MAG: hypothetical protein HYZ16_11990 [Bacteroidetes bacterium]|jgi:hypothetical protein|nr:hypothetical protein [Bacteroidota bacterium]